MSDSTGQVRRQMVAEINAGPRSREDLEKGHGRVWDTRQLQEDYEVIEFAAPFAIVRRLSDGVRGSLTFQNNPRFYFDFEAG